MIKIKSTIKRGVSVKVRGGRFDTANEAVGAAVGIVEAFQQADYTIGELVREAIIRELEKLAPINEATE